MGNCEDTRKLQSASNATHPHDINGHDHTRRPSNVGMQRHMCSAADETKSVQKPYYYSRKNVTDNHKL